MREDEDKDYKLEWRKAMDELVNLRQEYRELKEDKDYIKSLLDAEFKKGLNLEKENEQLKSRNKKIQYINDQLEERLENSGIGIALKMDCDMMGEKRFSIFDDDEVEDVWNELKGTIYCYNEEEAQRCENWLNNLHNQNQKLKEENEQLKQEIVLYKKAFQQQVQRCTL